MNPLQRWIVFTAVNTAAAAVIKSMLRAKPERHMQYVDFLYEQAKHEADRFRRLHPVKKKKKHECSPETPCEECQAGHA
jgi:hypothetical protein